jgi:hypothetical protein
MNEESKHMFDEGPLREAMITYLSMNYEEATDYSEQSMVDEYNYLKKTGGLNAIFEAVHLIQLVRLF